MCAKIPNVLNPKGKKTPRGERITILPRREPGAVIRSGKLKSLKYTTSPRISHSIHFAYRLGRWLTRAFVRGWRSTFSPRKRKEISKNGRTKNWCSLVVPRKGATVWLRGFGEIWIYRDYVIRTFLSWNNCCYYAVLKISIKTWPVTCNFLIVGIKEFS